MNDIPPVVISGSGKYVLVAVSKDAVRVELLRGGSAFKMHKDIIASLDSELGVGYVITPEGGGVIVFTEGEHPLIAVSGESQKYGPPTSIVTVLSLLTATYPGHDILSDRS